MYNEISGHPKISWGIIVILFPGIFVNVGSHLVDMENGSVILPNGLIPEILIAICFYGTILTIIIGTLLWLISMSSKFDLGANAIIFEILSGICLLVSLSGFIGTVTSGVAFNGEIIIVAIITFIACACSAFNMYYYSGTSKNKRKQMDASKRKKKLDKLMK